MQKQKMSPGFARKILTTFRRFGKIRVQMVSYELGSTTMRTIKLIGVTAGLILSVALIHSQTLTVSGSNRVSEPAQTAAPESVVQATAEAQGLQLISPDDLPPCGTYWEIMPDGAVAPLPCPPFDPTLPVYAITENVFLVDATGGQLAFYPRQTAASAAATANSAAVSLATAVANLIQQVQTALANQQAQSMMRGTGTDFRSSEERGDFGGGGDFSPALSCVAPLDANGMWLEITNVSDDHAYLNLHNGTNTVYAIWSTTNLLAGWSVEREVRPTNGTAIPTVTPFRVRTLDRQNLFLRAEDWTGVDSDRDGVPDWWAWLYWGTNNVPDTNLDYSASGYTFGQDFCFLDVRNG